MDVGSRKSISEEISLELLSLMFSSCEYHDLIIWIALEETLENWIFVPDTDSHEDVLDRIDGCRGRESQ